MTAVMVVLMFINTPKTWHRSFFVLNRDPQDMGSTAAGVYEAPILFGDDDDAAGAWTAASCGGIQEEAAGDVELWRGDDDENEHHIISKRMRDICRFQRVGKAWVHAGDPRSLHALSSGTPAFLLVSAQVVVFASLLATSSMVKTFFSTQIFGMGRKRVWMPVDQVIAAVLLLGWVAFSLLMQSTFVIVYNNILFIGLLAVFTIVGIIVWSWRKAVPSAYMAVSPVEPPATNPNYDPSADAFGNVPTEQARLKRKVVFRMPAFTNIPMVPYDYQGDNDGAEKNPTLHMVDQTFDVLWRNHVLVFPRFILAASILPVLLAAAMFKAGSIWLYSDVFYLTLSSFLTTGICVPLYAMTRISVMVAVDGSEEWRRGRSSLSWYVVVVHLLFAHFLFLGHTAFYFYLSFYAGDIADTQPDNSMMAPLIVAAAVVVYNLSVWGWCLVLIASPRTGGGPAGAFGYFAWFMEGATALCLTGPAVLLFIM